jgi:hypothetical protein
MSEKVITIEEKETEKDCNNIPESETKADTNTNKTKILSLKKIEFIILFIIILLGLFFFASYLSPSKKSQKNINIANEQLIEGLRKTDIIRERDDQVIKEQVRNEDRDLIKQQLIKDPDIIKPAIKNVTNEPSVIVKPVITNSYEKKVLLITNHFSKKTTIFQKNISPDVLYNLLLQIKTVEVTVLDAYDPCLDNTTLSYLKNFDLVVLDFIDAGFTLAERCKNFTRNLMQYIKEGGALFSGHDQFDQTHKKYITQEAVDMLSLLGFIHQNGWGVGSGSTVYFEKSAIKNSIFLANHALYGDSIPISYTHQTYSKYNTSCKTCNVILKFVKNGADTYEYLVTNRPNNKGKTVNIRAGHSSSFTEAEKKIFLSSILWLLYEI